MPSQTIAFFGATGDCAGFCLASSLDAGYDCVALARTPSKLTNSMIEKGISSETLEKHLTIIDGDAMDVEAVKRALQVNGQVVDKIVSGIGGTPIMQWSIVQPVTLTDPTICQDASNTILHALQELKSATKPLIINVLTIGIPPKGKPRDVPLVYLPLYHWLLDVPRADKGVMEERLAKIIALPESQRHFRGYVNVKPTIMTDGPGRGVEKVRAGYDEKPAIGYMIQRKDVGVFMFERLVKEDPKPEWWNKGVSVTY